MNEESKKLSELVKDLRLEVLCGGEHLDRSVTGGYVSDLLSDVMAHTKKGALWITLQGHPNIVAVAVLKELSGIVLINKRQPDEETLEKARNEKVAIMTSELPAFELVGKLYQMGLSGTAC
ncbi:serine kinase [candidate division WOR_3 bacterium SM23_60]|uniref:Serine kinase n=1 Tax=candidate division WOR_3 bacterium SM23_60 TaxID=1703780 RepID=A0A0S8GAP5_UNCW3|nr:MAG: serine kinase [candidate division WOR_3 bacterium SM23_60]